MMHTTPPASSLAMTLLLACAATCLAVASVYLSQPVFADIAASFSLPASDARLGFSVASLAYALAFFILGPWSDYLPAAAMARRGLVLGALCLGAVGMLSHFSAYLLAVGAAGACAAMVPAAMFALLPRLAPPQQLGSYFGLIIAASVVGITLGRAGMGLLAGVTGWQHAYLIAAAALLLMALATYGLPPEPPRGSQAQVPQRHTYYQSLAMLAEPGLRSLFMTGFLLFFAYLGMVTFLTYRLQQPPFHYDSTDIGKVSLVGLIAVLGAPLSGRLANRYGPRQVALAGLALVALAIGLLWRASASLHVSSGLFLLFLGVFSCQPAIFVQIAGRAGASRRGTASSLYLLICLGAGSLSSTLLEPAWRLAGWAGVSGVALGCTGLAALVLLRDSAGQHPSR